MASNLFILNYDFPISSLKANSFKILTTDYSLNGKLNTWAT
jgi:hypothetical protein